MTDQQIREAHLSWINDFCNQEYTEDDMPGGVKLILNKLIAMNALPIGVTHVRGESVADLSRTFGGSVDGELPTSIKVMLYPYRRIPTVKP